jgi:ubiquitin-conjugating enzyme E2 J2
VSVGITPSNKGINNIKAGDGGLKFRTEWQEMDQENWHWMKVNRIDIATGQIVPDTTVAATNSCSPETSAFRRRPVGSGPRLGAVMEGGQVAKEAGQSWVRRHKFLVVLGLIFGYVLVSRMYQDMSGVSTVRS